jgi:hypothetical protein
MEGVPASRGYTGGFGTDLMLKDIGLALEAAISRRASVLLGGLAESLYAPSAAGNGRLDFSSIIGLFGTGVPRYAAFGLISKCGGHRFFCDGHIVFQPAGRSPKRIRYCPATTDALRNSTYIRTFLFFSYFAPAMSEKRAFPTDIQIWSIV